VGNHDCLPWYYFLGQSAGNIQVVERFHAARGALVALHGHQFDPFNRVSVEADGHVKVPLARKLVQLLGFLERTGGEAVREKVDELEAAAGKALTSLEQLTRRLGQWGEAIASRYPHWPPEVQTATKEALYQTQFVLERESPGERGYPFSEQTYEEAARALMRSGARFVLMGHTHHPAVVPYGRRLYVNTGSWVWDRYPPTYARYQDGYLELLRADTHQPYQPESTLAG
jgi:UDP-2,3-diacylglucosamine pyrophosphatase LpxH